MTGDGNDDTHSHAHASSFYHSAHTLSLYI